MRILIIEDDLKVAKQLKKILRPTYVVDVIHSGHDVIYTHDVSLYQLVILDLGLPGISGLEVCKNLRQVGYKGAILILTGSWKTSDKVQLLDAGADDYITKPYSPPELLARVRAVLRRQAVTPPSSSLQVGELKLDTVRRKVWREQKEIALRRKEFDLLECLMRNQGRTMTRSSLIDQVWEMNASVWVSSVDVHIKYLRDKVDKPFSKQLIKTVHGIGYRLED